MSLVVLKEDEEEEGNEEEGEEKAEKKSGNTGVYREDEYLRWGWVYRNAVAVAEGAARGQDGTARAKAALLLESK
jgi:hypothetical protein